MDQWMWDQEQLLDRNGWYDLRVFPHMTVVAGVGGGSLVYANIFVEAKPDTFDTRWPAAITYAAFTAITPFNDRTVVIWSPQVDNSEEECLTPSQTVGRRLPRGFCEEADSQRAARRYWLSS